MFDSRRIVFLERLSLMIKCVESKEPPTFFSRQARDDERISPTLENAATHREIVDGVIPIFR